MVERSGIRAVNQDNLDAANVSVVQHCKTIDQSVGCSAGKSIVQNISQIRSFIRSSSLTSFVHVECYAVELSRVNK